jgi:hypothetical protein
MQGRERSGRRWIATAALIAAAGLLSACPGPTTSNREEPSNQAQPTQEPTVDQAASAGLAAFKELAAGEDFRTLGLESSDEAANATLGQKYDLFIVGLDSLRGYKAGADPAGLLTASPDSIFPVLVKGQVRSSITVTRSEGGFVASEVGGAGVMQTTARVAERTPGDFLVRVPALGLQFVGRRANDRVLLTLTTADPRLKLRPGAEMPAEQVFQQLVPIAQAYNGEPM